GSRGEKRRRRRRSRRREGRRSRRRREKPEPELLWEAAAVRTKEAGHAAPELHQAVAADAAVPQAVVKPATSTSPPQHSSYDPEDYFDYFNHGYAGVDFSEEYNYSK
ncbi:unnamed protein product, partial [Urochloa humidicola]